MVPRLSLDLIKLGVALLSVAAVGAWFVRSPGEDVGPTYDAPAVTALLVDTSASVTRARKGWQRWAVRALGEEARAAAARGDEIALVTFDSVAQRRVGPIEAEAFLERLRRGSQEWLRPSDVDTATDLDGAARTASSLLGENGRAPGSIIVLGDGIPTGDDPSAALLSNPDSTVRLVEPPPVTSVDLAVLRTVAPTEVAPNVAVPVELDLVLTGPPVSRGARVLVDWSLQVTGTDSATRGRKLDRPDAAQPGEEGLLLSGTVLAGSAEIAVPDTACAPPGTFRARFKIPGQKLGSASLRASVRLAGVAQDPFPENDIATARWTVGDPVRVLVCAPRTALGSATAFFNGAAFDGIEFIGVAPESLATALAPASGNRPDALVTIELPFASLPTDALRAFVETWGGGWLHAAGWPLTRTDAEGLAELAALEPDVEPKPPRDIVLLVDGSGSMEGERWMSMRRALRVLIPRVPATDTLSLRFFTEDVGREELRLEAVGDVELSPAEEAERADQIRRLMRLDVPGGSTNIVKSLFGLTRVRAGREHSGQIGSDGKPENDGLIILISDGETQSLAGRRKTTRAKIAKGLDDLVVIHVGDERGVIFLKGLLRKGEEVVLVQDLGRLVDRLREAILDLHVVEDARLAPVDELAPGVAEPWRSALSAAVERIPTVDPVVLQGAIPARATAGAVGLANLVSEPLRLAGRTPTFAAAAERGRGWAAGLAAPLLEADADERSPQPSAASTGKDAARPSWTAGLRHRSGWLAPLFRDAARRRKSADLELAGEALRGPTSAHWIQDPSRLLGAGTRRTDPVLSVESLPSGAPTDLVAEFLGGASLDGDGQRFSGERLAQVPLEFLPGALDPRKVRVVGVPPEVLDLPRGTEFFLRIVGVGASSEPVAPPIRLAAPGPPEATSFGVGQVAAALRIGPARSAEGPNRGAGAAADASPRGQRGHPWVPWLLVCGLCALLAGATLQSRDG